MKVYNMKSNWLQNLQALCTHNVIDEKPTKSISTNKQKQVKLVNK